MSIEKHSDDVICIKGESSMEFYILDSKTGELRPNKEMNELFRQQISSPRNTKPARNVTDEPNTVRD